MSTHEIDHSQSYGERLVSRSQRQMKKKPRCYEVLVVYVILMTLRGVANTQIGYQLLCQIVSTFCRSMIVVYFGC